MSLSDLSIRRPVFAWMLMIGLVGFGTISFFRLGVSQLPDVDFPVVTVALHMNGATPETMEENIVSIIIPCFNHGAFLKEAIDSVLNSTYKLVEILHGMQRKLPRVNDIRDKKQKRTGHYHSINLHGIIRSK